MTLCINISVFIETIQIRICANLEKVALDSIKSIFSQHFHTKELCYTCSPFEHCENIDYQEQFLLFVNHGQ